jgi:hypothetical protein
VKLICLLLFVATRSFAQEEIPLEVKLYSVEASREGVYASKWEKEGEITSRTNRIFIKNLPDTVATGDDWKGKLQRSGAHTLDDGTKIPQFVATSDLPAQTPDPQARKDTSDTSPNKSENTESPTLEGVIPMSEVEKGVFIVEAGESSGTGFLLNDPAGVYFFSNIHVFSIGDKAIIKNSKGEIIEIPKKIELAEGEDLLRFKAISKSGLAPAESPRLGEVVFALGNSSGSSVITKNSGQILGVGDSTFEVSCEIVPGNSGGPIIDKSGRVLGVASFLTYGRDTLATEGTRYSKARRFGITINRPLKWEAVDYETFRREAKFINSLNESLQAVFDCWDMSAEEKVMPSFKVSKDLSSSTRVQSKLDNVTRYHTKEYLNPYGNKSVKEMVAYMTTQLKESCELIISENRTSLDSNWAKAEYEKSKDWAARLSKAISEHRDIIRKRL